MLATALAMLRAEEGLRQELSAGAGALRGQLRMAAVPTAMPMLTRFAACCASAIRASRQWCCA